MANERNKSAILCTLASKNKTINLGSNGMFSLRNLVINHGENTFIL